MKTEIGSPNILSESYNMMYLLLLCVINRCTIIDCWFVQKTKSPKVVYIIYYLWIFCYYIIVETVANYTRTLVRIKVYPSSVHYHGSPNIFPIPIFVLRWVRNRRASVSRPLRRCHHLLFCITYALYSWVRKITQSVHTNIWFFFVFTAFIVWNVNRVHCGFVGLFCPTTLYKKSI